MHVAMSDDVSIQWRVGLLAALAVVAVLVSGFGASGGSASKPSSPSPGQLLTAIEAQRPDLVPVTCRAIARGEGETVEAGIDAFNRSKGPPPGYPSAASIYKAFAGRC